MYELKDLNYSKLTIACLPKSKSSSAIVPHFHFFFSHINNVTVISDRKSLEKVGRKMTYQSALDSFLGRVFFDHTFILFDYLENHFEHLIEKQGH